MSLITYVHLMREDRALRTLCGLVRAEVPALVVVVVNAVRLATGSRLCAQCLHRFHRIRA